MLRDHQFRWKVQGGQEGNEVHMIDPDRVHVLLIDGKPQLHFTEIKLYSGRHHVTRHRYLVKDESHKIKLWNIFYSKGFQKHPMIQYWQSELGAQFDGFHVHFVCHRRTDAYLHNLMKTVQKISSPPHRFRFAHLKDFCSQEVLRSTIASSERRKSRSSLPPKNMFEHRSWQLASGKKIALLPCQRTFANLNN